SVRGQLTTELLGKRRTRLLGHVREDAAQGQRITTGEHDAVETTVAGLQSVDPILPLVDTKMRERGPVIVCQVIWSIREQDEIATPVTEKW
ncbi:hypothetical protein OLF92_10950, partial [Streptococcus pneumoniae]|nr:hypothetical protein [Streptococcus pneumoniae]